MPAITFLMGADAGPGNAFYANAKGFFTRPQSEVIDAPSGGQTLEGVFKILRDRAAETPARIYDPINLVAHATGFSSLMFALRPRGPTITMESDLTREVAKINAKAADAWKQLGPPIVGDATKVVLYGCDVGRGVSFVRDLGRLFGEDLHVYAPLRVAVFRHSGSTFEHRLARTWSVPWPSNIARTAAAAWPATRAKFVSEALTKFGPVWAGRTGDPLGDAGLKRELDAAAASATAAQGASWFFEEQVTLTISSEADIQQMVPLRSAVISPGTDVDDTTVENVVGPAQMTDRVNATTVVAHIAVLAQIIEQAVDITNSGQYRHVDIDPPKAASPGPGQPAGAPPITPGTQSSTWDEARDALIAAGTGQDEIDALAAALAPTGDALSLADRVPVSDAGADLSAEDFV